ncbi:MAG: hypothetical protein AAGC64_00865 [Bacteroidota bacterium]
MKTRIIIAFILLFHYLGKSQNTDLEMATYNIAFGAITGGIGAVINKSPNQKFGKVFAKGALKGCLGGYLVFESKRIVRIISNQNKLEYAWPAKMVNSMGISILESAARNDSDWSRWHINVGFNRLDFRFKQGLKAKYRIMPISFLLTSYLAIGNRFDLNRSLLTGEFIFSSESSSLFSNDFSAVNLGNAILYKPSQFSPDIIAHEIIHSYQYYDFNFVNTWLEKPKRQLFDSSSTWNKLNDFLYFDLNGIPLRAAYLIEESSASTYFDNFFEFEAGYWSNTLD